jgi:hypothetical protein
MARSCRDALFGSILPKIGAADAVAVAAAAGPEDVAAVEVVTIEVDAEVAELELHPLATAVGEAWASELVRSLRAVDREIVGSWPGTLGEARMRIRVALRSKLELHVIEELARVAYIAARRGWLRVSGPDPEP